jgi:RHS repeat-associated protein
MDSRLSLDGSSTPPGRDATEWTGSERAQQEGKVSSASNGAPAPGSGALPSVSLPKGGGAIRGMDEKLSVNQPSGTASLAVEVFTSAARQGFGPKLTLSYDSGAGNGPFGLGWNLGVPAITRKTSKGLPRYEDAAESDVFILSGAEDLVPLLAEANGTWLPVSSTPTVGTTTYEVRGYRPRVEAGFARIERWQNTATGDVHWRTVSKDNVTSLYGQDQTSRIADPDDPERIFSWLLDFSFDDRGNAICYVYKPENDSNVPNVAGQGNRVVTANRYLKRVLYGNDTPYASGEALPSQWCFELVLDYGEHDLEDPTPDAESTWPCRPDPFSTYRSGFEVRTCRTCRRLLMFHQMAELGETPVVVRSTDLGYRTSDTPGDPALPSLSMLTSVTQTGWVPASRGGYQTEQLPALELGYIPLAVGQTLQTADPESLENLAGAFDGTRERWVDVDGEGLQGVLTEDDGGWYYKHNVSAWNPDGGPARARFEPLAVVADKPSGGSLTLTDLNGHGNLCAVRFGLPAPGWFEYDPDCGWSPFRELVATAGVDWNDPNLRFVDLDGDGLADVLITQDDALTWYRWEFDEGFAPPDRVYKPFHEDRGPALVFADGTGSIYLADMSGDGLADLVRIRNGEVCYWPNLGYGHFGAKITMDAAPVFDYPDLFDDRRVRLADIDGSGTTDLVYLGEQPTIWFNQSGNGWTDGTALTQFPSINGDVQTTVFDLLGAGTACLVWTSALPGDVSVPLRYIDLTGGVKPHLLNSMTNNLGAQRVLTYAPSTKFYVQDRTAGTPWVTRLPFPVHVVERVETDDAVSRTSYVAQYSYHHGFYDGVEREVRGFARVDVLDTDAIPAASGIGTFTSAPTVSGGEFELPPVWTRTWYHTGAFFGAVDIAARLAQEYWALDPEAPQLQSTIFPPGASAEEMREACRALRGRVLREEVYAQDGTPAALNPYGTSEHRYQVDLLQAPADASYGAFYGWERESVSCHYERNPSDPRIAHDLSLAIDAYGNLTRYASVGYPRRVPAYAEQAATLVRYRQADYVNVAGEPDWYRLGLPTESRDYELTGVAPTLANGLFDPDTLAAAAAAAAAADIPYEATPDGTTVQRRLCARRRTLYMSNALAELPLGQVESLALVYAAYEMRFTPGLLGDIFGAKLSSAQLTALLTGAGRLVDLDGDGNQWAPSPRLFYSPDPAAPDAGYAQAYFYLPQGSLDQWGNVSTVAYDDHNLLVSQTVDAVGNATVAASNYRVLGPWLLTDPNLNRSGVRFDPVGMVIASAVMGKLLPDGTDEGDHLDTSTSEPAAGDDPTTRLQYDLTAYATWAADPTRDPDHPQPVWAQTQARVLQKDPTTPWIQSYAYSDGLGRIALTKSQAEPGEAPERDASGNLVYDAHGNLVFTTTDNRWVGTGRIVFDNKGNPVKAYEPFFDSSPAYDDESDLAEWGVTSITRYDPLSRAIRIDNPNGTFRTVELDPWHTAVSDENDTVLDSAWYAARTTGSLSTAANESDAAAKAAAHANTPATSDLDTLARTFRTVADNGAAEQYLTTLTLDIAGRVLATTDPLGRQVLTQDYDLTGAEIHHLSVDSGERWLLADAGAQLLEAWDSRGFSVAASYDTLRRLTALQVTDSSNTQRLAEQIIYGEGLSTAQALNLRGVAYQHKDEVGLATTQQRDFQGNTVSASRQLLEDYVDDVDWSANPALNSETYTTAYTYDALGRVLTQTTPDQSVTNPTFNERNLLAAVTVNLRGALTPTTIVQSAAYDPKRQRQRIAYGNGATTSYTYDPETFRLTELTTTRPGDSGSLQDLSYTYDPVGNITRLTDAAQQTIFFDRQVVTPSADYTYDPIYRLVRATGREHVSNSLPVPPNWKDAPTIGLPLPTDGQAMGNYTETYAYDEVGNFQSINHSAAAGGWTRTYAYDEPTTPAGNNQLTSTTVGATTERYTYDANGNIASMPHLSRMRWDWKDQLQATASQIVNDGSAEITYYQYDSTGQRVTKATDNQDGNRTAQRTYLGVYEVYREYDATGNTVTLERQSLHIRAGAKRICLLETTTIDTTPVTVTTSPTPTPTTVSRYQLANHLQSALLELDASAAIISYEEYYPYGSTSFQSGRTLAEVGLKRYRYTGKERDSESGFAYHGARYYIPWLGRWASCDPAGMASGPNLYGYCGSNPVVNHDPYGRQPNQAKFGDIKPYKTPAGQAQGTAIYSGDIRLSEHEHVGARINWVIQTLGEVLTDLIPYDTAAYNRSLTITIPKDMANIKTQLDMWLRDDLRAAGATGPSRALIDRARPIESDAQRAIDARDAAIHARLQAGQSIADFDKITDERLNYTVHGQGGTFHEVGQGPTRALVSQYSDADFEAWERSFDAALGGGQPPPTSGVPVEPGSLLFGGAVSSTGFAASFGNAGRTYGPGVVEAEATLLSSAYVAGQFTVTQPFVTTLLTASEAVPVIGGVGVVGAGVGHLSKLAAEELGADEDTADEVGYGGAAGAGAGIGVWLGGPLGAAAGAGIGALFYWITD